MERPIRDIQQHIDYVGTLAEEEPDPKTRWQLQKRVAASVWQRDAKAYYEEQGAEFFDFGQWQLDQAYASYLYHESIKRYRKRQGDRQILARRAGLPSRAHRGLSAHRPSASSRWQTAA